MTDSTTPAVTNITAEIDKMIGALPTGAPAQMPAHRTADMRVEADGTITVLAPATHPGIRDTDGYVVGDSVERIDTEIARLTASTTAQTFDKVTGAPTFVRTDREREQDAGRLVILTKAREFQVQRDADIKALRDAQAVERNNALREQAAKFSFTGGDPARAALLDKAIKEAEAKKAADAIVGSRG